MQVTTITNIELFRRESLTIDELVAFALAFGVAPADLLTPQLDHRDSAGDSPEVSITPSRNEYAWFVRSWFLGRSPLPFKGMTEADVQSFRRKAPEVERRNAAASSHPTMMAIQGLQVFLRAAIVGPEDPQAITPSLTAEAIRAEVHKVARRANDLADDIDGKESWDDVLAARMNAAQMDNG